MTHPKQKAAWGRRTGTPTKGEQDLLNAKMRSALDALPAAERPKAVNKYKNKPVTVNGEKYRSGREMARHLALMGMEAAGLISDLRREVTFVLAGRVLIQGRVRPQLRYIADFVYTEGGMIIVEDAKGVRTEGYRIKRHLMVTIHNIEIRET